MVLMYRGLFSSSSGLSSPGQERPSAIDVQQSPNVQDVFRPIPGLIGCAGVTRSVGITHHTCTCTVHVYMYMYMYMYIHCTVYCILLLLCVCIFGSLIVELYLIIIFG